MTNFQAFIIYEISLAVFMFSAAGIAVWLARKEDKNIKNDKSNN